MNAWKKHLLSAFLLSSFLLSPVPLSAQYRLILDPSIPPIGKMAVFDDTLYGIPGYCLGNPGPLLFSVDRGDSWRSYRSPLDWLGLEVRDIAVQDTHLYVLTDRGLFRKSLREKAFRWVTRVAGTRVIPDEPRVHILDSSGDSTVFSHSDFYGRDPRRYAHPGRRAELLLAEESLLWLYTYRELYASSDLGATWKRKLGYPDNVLTSMVRFEGAWYGVPQSGRKYLYRSELGYSWQEWPLPFYAGEGTHLEVRGGRLCLWSEGHGAYWYDAAAGTWEQTAPPLPGMTSYHADQGLQQALVSGALYRYERQEAQWRLVLPRYLGPSGGMSVVATDQVLVVRSGSAPAVVQRFGESEWWYSPPLRNQPIGTNAEIDGVLYEASDSTMWRSTDGGATWVRYRTLPRKTGNLYADGMRLVTLTTHRPPDTAYVLHSDDLGATWQREGSFFDDQGTRAFSARDNRRIVVTRQNGPVDHWWYSSDAGGSWTDLYLTLQAPVEQVILGETRLFAQTSYGLWVSDDDGATWTGVYLPFEDFTLQFAIPRHVCLTGAGGFHFISEADLERRFIPFPPYFSAWSYLCRNNRSIFLWSQQTGGLWELDYEDAVLSVSRPRSAAAPGASIIEGISPSPLRASGLLHLLLPRAGTATLELHDALGRIVWRQQTETLAPGPHTLPLHRGKLPAGMYLLSVRTSAGAAIRPILLD